MGPAPDPSDPGPVRVVAVVLAGGTSRRFGSDKLASSLHGRALLDQALDGLPPAWSIVVVGPERPLSREVVFVREQPAGGGPGAALVRGAQAALELGASIMVTVAGDAPLGGQAADDLCGFALESGAIAAVATDGAGRDQPLQLCLRGDAIRTLADVPAPGGVRARDLLRLFEPLHRFALSRELTDDIDTPEDLAAWRRRGQPNS